MTPTTTIGAADLPDAMHMAELLENPINVVCQKTAAAVLRHQHSEFERLHALAAGQATAAQQGVAYAALPEKYYLAGGEVPTWDAKQMHAFADATYALRASHGQAQAGVTLRSMIEGMSVSVDVSTGDHDAGHRYFGTVTEVMECQGNKHGVTLLVQDAEPNFTATPTAPQPSPTAQADSGFDYKTAADFLSGKTVSDEAVRKFVAVSRWAHEERAALSATLLAMHGVLTSREAEIALLKQALLGAEAAPQQEAQGLVLEGYTLPPLSEPDLRDVGTKPQDIKDFLRGYATEYARRALRLSQPAPAPLSDDSALLDWIAIHGSFGVDSSTGKVGGNGQKCVAATRKNIRAAIAAQGGE